MRRLGWQLFDGLHSSRLALDYTLSGSHQAYTYNDYYAAYTTAQDLYTYDDILFSGRFMSRALTRAEVTPRGIAAPPDPGISHVEWADGWKTGYLFGRESSTRPAICITFRPRTSGSRT